MNQDEIKKQNGRIQIMGHRGQNGLLFTLVIKIQEQLCHQYIE
jgi:hypothetical protein